MQVKSIPLFGLLLHLLVARVIEFSYPQRTLRHLIRHWIHHLKINIKEITFQLFQSLFNQNLVHFTLMLDKTNHTLRKILKRVQKGQRDFLHLSIALAFLIRCDALNTYRFEL